MSKFSILKIIQEAEQIFAFVVVQTGFRRIKK